MEKILPAGKEDKEDSGSEQSSIFSVSEEHVNKKKDKKKKKFQVKNISLDKEIGEEMQSKQWLKIGDERPSLGSSGVDSLSEGGDEALTMRSRDEEEQELDESFEDGAEDSHVGKEGRTKRGGERKGWFKFLFEAGEGGAGEFRHSYSDRFQNFLSEVRMLRELNHPNICLLMGTCFVHEKGKNKLLLIYELMDEDLNSFTNNTLKRGEMPTLFQRLKIASQVASGLSWVASKGIIHGDLKPTNILRKGNVYKVTDFGLATFENRVDDFEGGAPIWSAPELLEKKGDASRAVDVFSFGYLLWHILLWKNEEQLYPHVENTAQLIDLVCVKHEMPPMPELPVQLQDLIHECLAYNDTERPTFNHIIQALNAAMLEAAIPTGDKLARKFWMHFFSSKSGQLQESVPTIIFLEKFLRFTGISSRDPLTEIAKDYFDPEGRGVVTLEHFGRIVSLFGPLNEETVMLDEPLSPVASRSKTPPPKPSSASSGRSSPVKRESQKTPTKRKGSRVSSRIFHEMADLRQEPWFCGAVATEKVQETLKSERPGSYLVRYSNNPKSPSSFCLSRVTKNHLVRHHYIVQKITDGVKQFGLHISKTDVIYGRSLSLLVRDPRIVASFYLAFPVNKVASFSQQHRSGDDTDMGGYSSCWEVFDSEEEKDDAMSQVGSPPIAFSFSPPSEVDVVIPPFPRKKRGSPRPKVSK